MAAAASSAELCDSNSMNPNPRCLALLLGSGHLKQKKPKKKTSKQASKQTNKMADVSGESIAHGRTGNGER
jgi:hypothetical protein